VRDYNYGYNVESTQLLNGLTALNFTDGAYNDADTLQFLLPSITYTQPSRTIFAVISTDYYNYTTYYDLFDSFNAEGVYLFIAQGDITFTDYNSFVNFSFTFNTTPGTQIICCTTLPTNYGIFSNGSLLPVSNNSNGDLPTGIDNYNQYIGKNSYSSPSISDFFYGDVLIFDGALTDIERQQVEGYLANKWGIQSQLPATHPYYSSSATVLYRPVIRTFQPVDIAGCALWLDGADSSTITTSSGNVTAWNDKSGNGNNTAVTGTPTVSTQSGKQYVYLNGSSGFSGAVSITTTQVSTFAVIIIPANQTVNSRVVSLGVTNAVDYSNSLYVTSIFVPQNTANIASYRDQLLRGVITNTASSSTPRITASLYDNTNGYVYLNGVSSSPIASTGSLGIQAYGIGRDVNAAAEFFVGYIGEVIIYDTAVTNTQRLQIEAYLAQKWGIASSLANTHPGYYLRSLSTVFTPKALGNVSLWLDGADASTITLSGSNVTAWNDKSGNGNNTTVTGTPTVSTQARNRYISLNGSSGFSGAVSITGNTITTFAVIIIPGNASGNARIVSLGVGTDIGSQSYVIPLYQLNGTTNLATYRNGLLTSITNTTTNSPILASSTYDNTNGYIYLNGGTPTSYSSSGAFGITSYGIGRFVGSASLFFTGYIGEVIIYNTALTTVQRQQVEGYLAWKWGTQASLPSTHPYIKSSP